MAKVTKQTQKLFLRLLNFTPELIAKIKEEAARQHLSLDALIRAAVEKHLADLKVAREQDAHLAAESEAKEYAHLVLKAHFAEDRNEFLTEDVIRTIGKMPPAIGNSKSH